MRLGIDFGTTHTVVAAVDRANYPVVGFEGGEATPSLVAVRRSDGSLRFGFEAAARTGDPDWYVLRSLKRLLHDAGPRTEIRACGRSLNLLDLMTAQLVHLRGALFRRSTLELHRGEPLEAAIGVPANASSAQRFLTLEAFRRAGFRPIALVNEPSAAGFEYAHRHRRTLSSRREHVVVYDLGGGTFDASLVRMTGEVHEVVASAGIPRLGGDDFDAALAARVRAALGRTELRPEVEAALLDECRRAKEALAPNARRWVVDLALLGEPPLVLPVEEVFEACSPLVEETLDVLATVIGAGEPTVEERVGWEAVAGLYVVGGASAFPLVGRRLRERFGERRVRRSPHPFAATAIGLAILADEGAGYALADRLARTYGVWREEADGHGIRFDPVFAKDTPLPERGAAPLEVWRHYRAAHNIGHYRIVECGHLRDGLPQGEVLPWQEVRVPFEAGMRRRSRLDAVPVVRLATEGPRVVERWRLGAEGMLEFEVSLPDEGFERRFALARPTEASRTASR
jgi:molecular chaperone DnaK (HSP70)